MQRLQRLFLLAAALIPVHIAEQLMFGIDELYELRSQVGVFYSLSADADRVTVVLVGAVVTLVLLCFYAFMAGGTPRLIAATFFGFQFMYEFHHVAKTIARGEYFPGAVTSLGLVAVGAAVVATAWREFAATRNSPGVASVVGGRGRTRLA
jgi:hypothetical protein